MRKSMITLAAAAIAMTFSAVAAQAQSNTPGVDWRQHNQSERIYNGIQNGSLTMPEAGGLIRGQARIHRMERRFGSDGVVTGRERLRLHRNLNRQNRRIFRRKHN